MDFVVVGFFETFLEGSVDRVICRDYIVNRRFFTYCGLAAEGRLQRDHRVISLLSFLETYSRRFA